MEAMKPTDVASLIDAIVKLSESSEIEVTCTLSRHAPNPRETLRKNVCSGHHVVVRSSEELATMLKVGGMLYCAECGNDNSLYPEVEFLVSAKFTTSTVEADSEQ